MDWRAGILKKDGMRDSDNFPSLDKAEAWVLEQAEHGIKMSIIVNKKNINEKYITNWEDK